MPVSTTSDLAGQGGAQERPEPECSSFRISGRRLVDWVS